MTTFGKNRPEIFSQQIMIIYAPFESPNQVGSEYAVLDNVRNDLMKWLKKFKKPIHIPTIKLEIQKKGFYGFLSFWKPKRFFCGKKPQFSKRGIQGLYITKNRKSQLSAVFEF